MAKPSLIYNPKFQVYYQGVPLNGGKVFIYAPGTTTKINTYTDSSLGVTNPNPVILDSDGRPSNSGSPIDMYVTQSYKIVVAPSTDTDPPSNPIWTEDNVSLLPQTVTSVSKTANYTVTTSDRDKYFKADVSGGSWTLSLPSTTSAGDGFVVQVKKIDNTVNQLTITPNGTDNLNGVNSSILLSINNPYTILYCDGTQWFAGFTLPSVTTGISANSSGTLAGGTLLTTTVNNITTVGGASYSVTLPTGTPGLIIHVINKSGTNCKVFPDTATSTIDGGAGGASVTLTSGTPLIFYCVATSGANSTWLTK